MTALLAGATGLIGREVARHWTGPGPLHLLVRKARSARSAQTTPQADAPLLREHVVDFSALPPLPSAEMAFCCLGTTIKVAGSQAGFRAVDFDAVLHFARAAQRAGVRHFGVVSSLGASAKSSSFYNRVKGEMEDELQRIGFATLVIARPSLLAGDRASLGQPQRLGERITLAMMGPLEAFIPKAWRPIQAAVVARALLRAVGDSANGAGGKDRKTSVQILESADLQDLGA